jgi:mono/diheme cytochrome c family protein
MDKYCTVCHDADGTGGSPMPLLTYEDMVAPAVLTKGKKVYETVGTRVHDTKMPMPPTQKLSAAELATIDEFVTAKAPKGDDATCGADD